MRNKVPELIQKNAQLTSKIIQLEEDLKVVQWYMEVFESGIDTKDVCKEFTALQSEHKKLKKSTSSQIEKLTVENKKLAKKLAKTS